MGSVTKKIVLGALLSACLFAGSEGHAQDIKERTLKFSFVQPIDSHMGLGVQKFAEIVSEKSGKKITVKPFANGTLGGDIQMISSLQGGTVDMTTLPPGLLVGQSKEFMAFDIPFLFNSFDEADAVLDGAIGKQFFDKLPRGLVGLAYWDHGFRNVSNSKRAIKTLEDVKGLKIRVLQSPIMLDTFSGLGANAVPMPFTELYTALETGTVDGQDNPIVAFETNKFDEVQKHLSLTRHVYNPLIVLVGQKSWEKLSADERKIISDAAFETRAYQRKLSRDMEAKSIENVKSKGTIVTEVSLEERGRMREYLKDVTAKYTAEIGEKLVKDFDTEIENVRSRQ